MSSTLPKSVQAQMGGDLNAISSDRLQQIKDFTLRYKTLPNDFLRLEQQQIDHSPRDLTGSRQIASDGTNTPIVEMIEISVVEAKLVKNYGLLKMDLYCKIRVGHLVCETQTCPNGAKNPKWDGVYQFNLKPGLDSFHLEIYDERQFSPDEKIAWLYEPIPPEVFQGMVVERWFPLSGKLGPDKEGSVLLVLSLKRMPARGHPHHVNLLPNQEALHVYLPTANQSRILSHHPILSMEPQIPTYVSPLPPPGSSPQLAPPGTVPSNTPQNNQPAQVQQPLVSGPVSTEDIDQLSEMFPSISKSVIKSILENHNNDKEAAISYLLSLS